MIRRPPRSTRTDTLLPYTTLFRSAHFDIQIGDDDLGALLGKKPSLRCTQAARRARSERDFSCHSVAHPAILLPILSLLNSFSAQFRPARSEERRVGNEWFRQCRCRVSPYCYKKKQI